MKQLAEGSSCWAACRRNAINVYLAGDVLIDAGTRQAERRIMRQIAGRDAQRARADPRPPRPPGLEPRDLRAARIPLWCGRGDVPRDGDARRRSRTRRRPGWLNTLQKRFWTGPPHPVARALGEGDEVAGFTVLETPGHSRGPRRLLARVRSRADPRRRAQQHEPHDRHPRPARAARRLHARPGRATAQSARRLAALRPRAGLLRPRRSAARPRQARRLRRVSCPSTTSLRRAERWRASSAADGGRFIPTEHARGPWDPQALHGGAPAALIAAAFEPHEPAAEMRDRAARLRVPAPDPVRAADASRRASCGPDAACRSSRPSCTPTAARSSWSAAPARCASRPSRRSCRELPDGAARDASDAGAGAGARPSTSRSNGRRRASFAASAMEMRWLDEPWALGPGRVWMRLRQPLAARRAGDARSRGWRPRADFGNGISASLPFERFLFINADLTCTCTASRRASGSGWTRARCCLAGGGGSPKASCTTRAARRPRLPDARRAGALSPRAQRETSSRRASSPCERSSVVDAVSSASCSIDVALAIGARTVGCARSHASETLATAASCAAAISSSAASTAQPRSLRISQPPRRHAGCRRCAVAAGTCPTGSRARAP